MNLGAIIFVYIIVVFFIIFFMFHYFQLHTHILIGNRTFIEKD